jgi:hypothetical protein
MAMMAGIVMSLPSAAQTALWSQRPLEMAKLIKFSAAKPD